MPQPPRRHRQIFAWKSTLYSPPDESRIARSLALGAACFSFLDVKMSAPPLPPRVSGRGCCYL
jgi:hypothetical protein